MIVETITVNETMESSLFEKCYSCKTNMVKITNKYKTFEVKEIFCPNENCKGRHGKNRKFFK